MRIINSLKDLVKITMGKVLITATLMIIDFMLFLFTRTFKITIKVYTSQSHHVKLYILMTIRIKNILPQKLMEINLLIGRSLKKKLPVTIILRDSIVKEVKAGEISEENNKVVQNSSVDLLLIT